MFSPIYSILAMLLFCFHARTDMCFNSVDLLRVRHSVFNFVFGFVCFSSAFSVILPSHIAVKTAKTTSFLLLLRGYLDDLEVKAVYKLRYYYYYYKQYCITYRVYICQAN